MFFHFTSLISHTRVTWLLQYMRLLVIVLTFGAMLCRMEQLYEDIVATCTYCWTCALFWNCQPNVDCFLHGYWHKHKPFSTIAVGQHIVKPLVYITCVMLGWNASWNILLLLAVLFLTAGKHDNAFKYAASFLWLFYSLLLNYWRKLILQDIYCKTWCILINP